MPPRTKNQELGCAAENQNTRRSAIDAFGLQKRTVFDTIFLNIYPKILTFSRFYGIILYIN